MAAERLGGMASFLCAELLDFVSTERRHGAPTATPACGPGECPGLGHLAELARTATPDSADGGEGLLRRFGSTLFATLVRRYPSFFVGIASTRELLQAFEGHLAGEITKLAPHLVLPSVRLEPDRARGVAFACHFPDGRAELAALVQGLVAGSVAHFGEPLAVARRDDATPGVASFVVEPRARFAAAGGVASPATGQRGRSGSSPRRG